VTVTDRISIDDLPLSHIFTDFASLLLVDMFRERPVLLGNLSIVSGAGYEGTGNLLEGCIEGLVIQKDPIIMKLSVESVLDLSN
jgi:hypothetical protein